MLEEARALFQNDCDNTNNNVTRAKDDLTDAEKALMLLKERCHQITHTVAANGRSRRRTATLIDNDELQQVNMQLDNAINEVSEKKKNMNDATKEAEDK